MELCRSKQTPYPKGEQVNCSLIPFWIVDFANTSANSNLHENHNKNKRWRAMRLHFPDINGTRFVLLFILPQRLVIIHKLAVAAKESLAAQLKLPFNLNIGRSKSGQTQNTILFLMWFWRAKMKMHAWTSLSVCLDSATYLLKWISY